RGYTLDDVNRSDGQGACVGQDKAAGGDNGRQRIDGRIDVIAAADVIDGGQGQVRHRQVHVLRDRPVQNPRVGAQHKRRGGCHRDSGREGDVTGAVVAERQGAAQVVE